MTAEPRREPVPPGLGADDAMQMLAGKSHARYAGAGSAVADRAHSAR